jgi:alkylation response protein AidB-like acyl-CoA dehydrogenase
MIGGSAIGAADIVFTDMFVPDRDLAAQPGQAFKRAMTGITGARTHVAAMLNGIAAECLDRAVDHAGARQAFGQRLLDHQGLRWMLADVATQLEASRLLTRRAADLIQQGHAAILEASQAKSFATDMAGPAVATCMQAMGAIGLIDEQPFARHLAATRIAAYVDGTTEMQRDRIGLMLDQHYGRQSHHVGVDGAGVTHQEQGEI